MRLRRGPALAASLLLAWPLPSQAAELAGVALPDTVTVEGRTLALNGIGLREVTLLKLDVYVAGLYLEQRSSDPAAILADRGPKRLEIRMTRAVSRTSIAGAWRKGIERNAGDDLPALKERLDRLESCLTDLRRGDPITLTEVPGRGIVLEIRGERAAEIPGADFARALWRVWLGRHPPGQKLKRGLLGLPP